ncbi:heavy metal-responsive transcriptional regulator [Psychromonas sp. MB-3u-54]|uniref:MerR family transcriptional regulator n=1 Tax=Psychromonas sp. MB-3u-54 TaxID=2058319 RepID=UPI000C336535|nr:MerR family transcriptional regulator [Psychromonas sp. MB-3u-54]PKH02106.1 heavy metal-responsive transcriptional regulator [Psychromonas sp. MB-3u-54]
MLTISQAAKETGLSVKSIRYYEQIGLTYPPPRGENDYRYYPSALIKRLHFIKKTKDAGFSLKESKKLLALAENSGRRSADVKALLSQKIEELQIKIKREQALLKSLKNITLKCCGNDKPNCPIIDEFAN